MIYLIDYEDYDFFAFFAVIFFLPLTLHHLQMAAQQFIIFLLSEVETVAVAVFERFTVGTNIGFCPRAVTHNLVTLVPDRPKIVFVNISLNIIGT